MQIYGQLKNIVAGKFLSKHWQIGSVKKFILDPTDKPQAITTAGLGHQVSGLQYQTTTIQQFFCMLPTGNLK